MRKICSHLFTLSNSRLSKKTISISNPIGWEVISRKLIYNRSDGALIVDYIDDKEWVHTTQTPSNVRILRQTPKTYTVQLVRIDTQGNKRPDPELNLWSSNTPQQFMDRQKRALIGSKITPFLTEEIQRQLIRNAQSSYRGTFCGRSVFIVDYGNMKSYYDIKTGTLLAQYYQGVPRLILQAGKWDLRQGKKWGTYTIRLLLEQCKEERK